MSAPILEAEFEAEFRDAQHLSTATPGHLGHELQRCIEHEGRYLLLVRWTDVEAHEVRFRGSDRYGPFHEVLHDERAAGNGT